MTSKSLRVKDYNNSNNNNKSRKKSLKTRINEKGYSFLPLNMGEFKNDSIWKRVL